MRTGPAGAVEHGAPDRPLERGDLLAHGGLRVPEALRRPPERTLDGNGVERGEVAKFEAGERSERAGGMTRFDAVGHTET